MLSELCLINGTNAYKKILLSLSAVLGESSDGYVELFGNLEALYDDLTERSLFTWSSLRNPYL